MSKAVNGHITRFSDSSHYDEVCILCGYTDASDALDHPCQIGHAYAPTHDYDFKRSEKVGYDIWCKTCGGNNRDNFHHTCDEVIAGKTLDLSRTDNRNEPSVRHTPRNPGWTDYPLGDPRNGAVQENCANWRKVRAPLNIDATGSEVYKGHTTRAIEKIIMEFLDQALSVRVFDGLDILGEVKHAMRAENGYVNAVRPNGDTFGFAFSETEIVQTIDTWISSKSKPGRTVMPETAWRPIDVHEPYAVEDVKTVVIRPDRNVSEVKVVEKECVLEITGNVHAYFENLKAYIDYVGRTPNELLQLLEFLKVDVKMERPEFSAMTPYGEVFGHPDAVKYVRDLTSADAAKGLTTSRDFRDELTALINSHSVENGSDTPDFVLAQYLMAALSAFESAVIDRDVYHGQRSGGSGSPAVAADLPREIVDAETHH